MEKKQFFAFVIVLLLIATFLIIHENYQQMQNAKMLEKITREQTEIMRHFGEQKEDAGQAVDIGDEAVPMGAPGSPADPKYGEALRECVSRMFATAPTLASEYTAEAANHTGDAAALRQLCAEKLTRLSEISADGIAKMSEIHIKEDAENPGAYRNWVHKLIAVYEQEAEKITESYRLSIK